MSGGNKTEGQVAEDTLCPAIWGPHHMCTAHTHACTHSSFLYTISDASFYISTISFFKMITLLKCEKTTVHPLKVQGSAIPAYSQARQPSTQCNKNTSAPTGAHRGPQGRLLRCSICPSQPGNHETLYCFLKFIFTCMRVLPECMSAYYMCPVPAEAPTEKRASRLLELELQR